MRGALTPRLSAELSENFVRRARAFGRAALHVTLVLQRAVLSGEEHVALPHSFIAGKARVLPHAPIGIGSAQIRVERGQGAGSPAVPLGASAWKDFLETAEEGLRVVLRRRVGRRCERRLGRLGGGRAAAGVIVEDPGRSRLPPRDLPRVLITLVGVGRAVAASRPGARFSPVARGELKLQLAVLTAPQFLNGRVLSRVEARAAGV